MSVLLTSERLILREFADNDLDLLFHLDSDPYVLAYIGKPKTREESSLRLEKAYTDYKKGEGLGKWMAIEKESAKAIGWFVLNYLDNTSLIEIGYRLKKEFWGKGYATEMSKLLLEYGFKTLHLVKIVGVTHQENEASKRVLLKTGLEYIGVSHYYGMDCNFFEKENPLN